MPLSDVINILSNDYNSTAAASLFVYPTKMLLFLICPQRVVVQPYVPAMIGGEVESLPSDDDDDNDDKDDDDDYYYYYYYYCDADENENNTYYNYNSNYNNKKNTNNKNNNSRLCITQMSIID